MIKSPSLSVVFLIFLSVSVFAVKFGGRLGGTAPQTLASPQPQTTSLAEAELTLAARPSAATANIAGPTRIELTGEHNLLLIDDGRLGWMAEYSAAGELRAQFAGHGVPQFGSITDVASSPGRLWIADLLGRQLHRFDRASNRWTSLQLDSKPYRVSVVGTERDRLLTMHIGVRQTFVIRRENGERLTPINDLLANQAETALALDGFVASAPGATVYAGKHLAILASFRDDGSLNWLAEPIAKPETPLIMADGNKRWLQYGPLAASQSLAANSDVAAVLVRRVSGMKLASFVDLYRVADGRYVRSLRLPGTGSWTSISITDQQLYAANRDGLYQWPIAVAAGARASGERLIQFQPVASPVTATH